MNKRSFATIFFILLVSATLFFGIYDTITVYNKERFSDDISQGSFGVAIRISFLLPIILAEISAFFDFTCLLTDRGRKTNAMYILRMIALCISATVIVSSVIGYRGSTDPFFQILLLSSMAALIFVKAMCGIAQHHPQKNAK